MRTGYTCGWTSTDQHPRGGVGRGRVYHRYHGRVRYGRGSYGRVNRWRTERERSRARTGKALSISGDPRQVDNGKQLAWRGAWSALAGPPASRGDRASARRTLVAPGGHQAFGKRMVCSPVPQWVARRTEPPPCRARSRWATATTRRRSAGRIGRGPVARIAMAIGRTPASARPATNSGMSKGGSYQTDSVVVEPALQPARFCVVVSSTCRIRKESAWVRHTRWVRHPWPPDRSQR